jgi:TolB protein
MEPTEGSAQLPAWSPDGKWLAVQVSRNDGPGHLWLVDPATGQGTKLNPPTEPDVDEGPGWVPDGRRLVFQSNRTGRMEIWVMDIDGGHQRQVTGVTRPGRLDP